MTNEIGNLRFTASPEATPSFHDDGLVILHTGKGRLFSSNRTGAQIWRGIERQLPVEVIVQQLSGEYQIPQNIARAHTFDFLDQLQSHELVQRRAGQ
ncbi:MAG TPA: PqqD family protein [Pyrinomonadaceae bacterium]